MLLHVICLQRCSETRRTRILLKVKAAGSSLQFKNKSVRCSGACEIKARPVGVVFKIYIYYAHEMMHNSESKKFAYGNAIYTVL